MSGEVSAAAAARAAFSPDKFLKAFIATLVLAGHRSIPPRDRAVRKGFQRVVELLDEQTRSILAQKVSILEAAPWINTSNRLRLSPTGGVENWESALRSAQFTFTKVGNPYYELISFDIDKARAESELEHMSEADRDFVARAARSFLDQVAQDV